MSLQGAWNAALSQSVHAQNQIINKRKRMVNKLGEISQETIQNQSESTPSSPSATPPMEGGDPLGGIMQRQDTEAATERLNARMTNEMAAEIAQSHLSESDTASNNLHSVVSAIRSRSTRDKFRRQRELRKRREGRQVNNGAAQTS